MTWAWSPGCWQHLGSPVLCSVSVHAMMLSGVGSVTQPGLYAPTEVVKEVLGHWICSSSGLALSFFPLSF